MRTSCRQRDHGTHLVFAVPLVLSPLRGRLSFDLELTRASILSTVVNVHIIILATAIWRRASTQRPTAATINASPSVHASPRWRPVSGAAGAPPGSPWWGTARTANATAGAPTTPVPTAVRRTSRARARTWGWGESPSSRRRTARVAFSRAPVTIPRRRRVRGGPLAASRWGARQRAAGWRAYTARRGAGRRATTGRRAEAPRRWGPRTRTRATRTERRTRGRSTPARWGRAGRRRSGY